MTYIKRSGVERTVMEEKEQRRQVRYQLDQMSGRSKAKGAMRADYKLCRENDKQLADFRRFKDKRDRKKIEGKMEQIRREYGKG